jgi:3,4-dihydroxy 2-butanone 4-phosphate synthase / GTP cyclohydrolase II
MTTDWLTKLKSNHLFILRDSTCPRRRAAIVAPTGTISEKEVNQIISITGGGLFFVAMTPERGEALLLTPMRRPQTSSLHRSQNQTLAFLTSFDARSNVTTGISASDRMQALRMVGAGQANPRSIVKPGHIFPIEVHPSGLLGKMGLAEGAYDIIQCAKLGNSALFVDLLNKENGDLLTESEQEQLAHKTGFPIVTLDELIRHRLATEKLVERVTEAALPTHLGGSLRAIMYRSASHSGEHLVLVKGDVENSQPVLTRVQAEFTFSDVFGGSKPSSRDQLHAALSAIERAPSGILVYLRRTEEGQLTEQMSQHYDNGQTARGLVMMRQYGVGAQILHDLKIKKVTLLTNSNSYLPGLDSFGIEIVERCRL